MSEALINNKIYHEGYMTVISHTKNYRQFKESIKMMNSQRSDTEKINLVDKGKKQALKKLLDVMNLLIAV